MDQRLDRPPWAAAAHWPRPRNGRSTAALLGACLVASAPACAANPETEPLNGTAAVPMVATPTRLRQPLDEVPASVTVITADMLRRWGITSIADALRLVPGMQVTESSGNRILINYHGTNNRDPRRLNVLVDGISVYRPGFARLYWTHLPVAIEDIERIEVTRSPSSAAYGPNSMMAVINIVSRHPSDVEPASLTARAGNQGSRWLHARLAGAFGSTTVHLAASAEQVEGFDRIEDDAEGHDRTRTKRLLARSHTTLGGGLHVDAEAAHVEGDHQIPFRSRFEDYPDRRMRDSYAAATIAKQLSATHALQLRGTYSRHESLQAWRTCFPRVTYLPELFDLFRASPDHANALLLGQMPSGGSADVMQLTVRAAAAIRRLGASAMQPLCGIADQGLTERRADLELQDTLVVSQGLRVLSGIGIRSHRATSQTFLGGSSSSTLYRLFGNVEYKPTPDITINVGTYAEHERVVGWSVAPRLGFNVRLAPGHSLRAAVAKGIRMPDLVELHGNFTYTVRTESPGPDGTLTPRFYQSAVASTDLRNEQAVTSEIGYLVNEPRLGLHLDVKVFEDRLKHLISEVVTVATFTPTNDNAVTLRGAELQASLAWSPAWNAFLHYAYLDNVGATTFWERTQYSRHSGAVGLSHSARNGWRWALAYYGASGDGHGESRFGRTDLSLARRFDFGTTRAEATLTLRQLDNPATTYILSGPVRRSEYDSRTQVFAGLRLSL